MTYLKEVGTIFIPVTDQEKALDFYVNKLGFEKRADFNYSNGIRWIEVAPKGASNSISLVPSEEGKASSSDQAYCAFATDDIKSDHEKLKALGVDVDPEIASQGSTRLGLISLDASVANPIPAQFFFRDIDGNRFLIVQQG